MRAMYSSTWILVACLAIAALAVAGPADAGNGKLVEAKSHMPYMFEVTITNITSGQVLSPPIVVVHQPSVQLFTLGEAASDELAAVAEDADAAGLLALLDTLLGSGVDSYAVADGPLPPGHSVTLEVSSTRLTRQISSAAMLVTTNDAFTGLRGVDLFGIAAQGNPFFGKPAILYTPAYDAGTEANTEMCEHIPGPPCGHPFERVPEGAEGFVHIHDGIHGLADLPASEYDWNNPVAMITIARVLP